MESKNDIQKERNVSALPLRMLAVGAVDLRCMKFAPFALKDEKHTVRISRYTLLIATNASVR